MVGSNNWSSEMPNCALLCQVVMKLKKKKKEKKKKKRMWDEDEDGGLKF